MKKTILLLAFALLINITTRADSGKKEQGMKFFHGSFEELLKEAKKENKHVFIDFYTKWCGPCKMMARDVFPLPAVGEFYNQYFICYKLDAEEGEGPALKKKYKVQGYPTFIFADAEGRQFYKGSSIGSGSEEGMIRLGKLALGLDKRDWDWYQKEYKKGNRERDFLRAFIKARLVATRELPSEELYMELINSCPAHQKFNKENCQIIANNAVPGNEFYRLLIQNKEHFPMTKDRSEMISYLSRFSMDSYKAILKRDFSDYFDQLALYSGINEMGMKGKHSDFIEKMIDYSSKYGKPKHLEMMLQEHALMAKRLSKANAELIREPLKSVLNESKPGFFDLASYVYLTAKAGHRKEAKRIAKKYQKLTQSYKSSNKNFVKWAYSVMTDVSKGKEPVPNRNN